MYLTFELLGPGDVKEFQISMIQANRPVVGCFPVGKLEVATETSNPMAHYRTIFIVQCVVYCQQLNPLLYYKKKVQLILMFLLIFSCASSVALLLSAILILDYLW